MDDGMAEGRGVKKGMPVLGDLGQLAQSMYIRTVPSYGNSFFFTIGVYLLELFAILAVTGMIMLVFGPYWWDLTAAGTFLSSVHLWAAEAFVTLMLLHLFVNFSTSAFKRKKLIWAIGSVMLMLVLLQFAFGIGIAGGLLSQWNDKAGADLWNGLGLGYWVNPLNNGAVLGWHVAIVPLLLAALIFTHYSLVRKKGISRPYRKDIRYSMVTTDHGKMYRRMAYVLVIVLLFGAFLRVPYVPPLTIAEAAHSNPGSVAVTILQEFNFSSGTAVYNNTIDPYTFNTRQVYVTVPYLELINVTHSRNYEAEFLARNSSEQRALMAQAFAYFNGNGSVAGGANSTNPLIVMTASLTGMAEQGLYQSAVQDESASGLNYTYVIRFLSDSGALQGAASEYGMRVSQFGMLSVGKQPWYIQYWLLPYNLLEISTRGIQWWGDLENGVLATVAFLALLSFPFIPYLNELPDRLGLYKLFWNRFTIPEMRRKARRRDRRGGR